MAPTQHQEILIVRSKLSLLLCRCLRTATVQRPQQNLQGLQTPPDPAPRPRPPEREWPYHEGLSLASAREQAIQHWNLPKRPEYGTLAKRTRTFYQGPTRWDPKGKPSVGSIAAAGFYYDGFKLLFKISNFPHLFKISNFKSPASVIRDTPSRNSVLY